jgi:diacylglycerol kinase (ATP)
VTADTLTANEVRGDEATPVCAVLRNPAAGRGLHAAAVERALEILAGTGHEVRVLPATTRPEALQQCRQAVADGASSLVTIGGDGTMHLGLQAVAGTGVAFGVIPAGTGNDFAVEIGIDADVVRAATDLAQALTDRRTRSLDLAYLEGPGGHRAWFGAVLAAGFDSLVNERGNAMRWPKGPSRYNVAIFVELMALRSRRYRVTLDGVAHEFEANLVAVGNTASYGGGMRMCPAAVATDGKLDVVVGGPISRTTLIKLRPKLFSGTHVDHPAVKTYRVESVTIEAEGITTYVDGERTCPLPVTVTARPGALALLAP